MLLPESPSPLAAGFWGGAQTAGRWETLGTPGSQVRVHRAYVTTRFCWPRWRGRGWAQVAWLIYGTAPLPHWCTVALRKNSAHRQGAGD